MEEIGTLLRETHTAPCSGVPHSCLSRNVANSRHTTDHTITTSPEKRGSLCWKSCITAQAELYRAMEADASQSLAARARPHCTGSTASILHLFLKVTQPKLELTCLNSSKTFIEHLDALAKVAALHVTKNAHHGKKKIAVWATSKHVVNCMGDSSSVRPVAMN